MVRYYDDKKRYADLINGFIFRGGQVIKESDIVDLDSRSGGVKMDVAKKAQQFGQIFRDMIRKLVLGMNFMTVAIENQDEIHYAMPIRILYGDALAYQKQMEDIQKNTGKTKIGKRMRSSWESFIKRIESMQSYPLWFITVKSLGMGQKIYMTCCI